jgi:hypothetical protein
MREAIPAAYKRAIIARKSGVDYFGPNSMKMITGGSGFTSSSYGRFENKLLKGLGKSIKEGDKGDAALKLFGQSFKIIHALGALDAFANTLTVGAVGSVLKKKESEKGEWNRYKDANYKALAEKDYANFKSDTEIEVDILIQEGKVDKENRDKEVTSLMREKLGITGNFRSPKSFYVTNRTQEIRENQLGANLEYAVSLAKEASLMGQPDGLMGITADNFQKRLSITDEDTRISATAKFLGGSIFRFLRLTAQAGNKTANAIPFMGVINSVFGIGWDPINEKYTKYGADKYRVNKTLANNRIAKNAIISMTTLILIANMFEFGDEDDDALDRLKNFFSGPSKWNLDPNRTFDIQAFGHTGMKG